MNESWNTVNMNALLPRGKSKDEVSMNDINSLLRGRTLGMSRMDEKPYEMNPPIPEYNEDDMKELQEYCAKRGILGVNFGGRNPKAVLQMLKARMGERNEPVVKKGLLNG